ncbi:MAG TPA: ATP-binding protein [Blastocatellia bacterium]|nr:ATP-binding protein [Blastocatellia bacterium]
MLVVAGPGMGLSTLARALREELRARGEIVALALPTTVKQVLLDLAAQVGLDPRRATVYQLQGLIAARAEAGRVVLLFDDAHRLPASFRAWLEHLVDGGQRVVLFATAPPRRDVFLRLPRIELGPLPHPAIREIMAEAGHELGRELTPAEISARAGRSGGTPLLARRAVREHLLGLEPSSPDHTEWIDGTPLLLAVVMVFSVLRYLGRGMHSTDLYLIGGRWRWESCACCSIPCPASRASSANDLTKGMPHA